MKKQVQLIMSAIFVVLANLTAYGQNVGVQFDDDYITYEITSTSPTPQVKIVGYDIAGGTSVDILPMVNYQGTDYDVTAIGTAAFREKGLEEVDFSMSSNLTSIGNWAFPDNQLTEVNIPNSVTSIGHTAFMNNQLTSVTIPNSLASIAGHTFRQNALTSVTLPNSVTSIGNFAFATNQLTSVTIGEDVTSIGEWAFAQNRLTSVEIPRNVTSIKQWTFAENDLTEVTIPPNVEHIGYRAFAFNSNLSIVTVQRNPPTIVEEFHENNENIVLVVPFGATIQDYEAAGWTGFASITYGVTTIDGIKYAIIDSSPNEATVILGNNLNPRIQAEVNIGGNTINVTAIGDRAFNENDIQTIVIPASVRSIGDRAFYSRFINRVMVNATEPPEIHPNAFQFPNRSDNINVFVPAGKAQDYIDAGWTGFKSVSSLEGQPHLSFGYLWEVTSVNPNKVRLIDFIGHPNTSTGGHVEIPSEISYLPNGLDDDMYSVTSIGEDALKNLLSRHGIQEALTSVEIPSSVDSIWNHAFAQNQLTEVDIPDGVRSIGEAAFAQNQLTEVEISSSVDNIGNYAFAQNQLTEVDIPDGVRSIGEAAFQNNNLANVTIHNGVQSIGKDAFWQNQLTSVEIPESVTSLGQRAFGNNDLTEVTLPNSITRIEQWVFARNDLKEVIIPANVEHIGFQAFLDNDLKEVTISGNVRTIDLYAFQNNPNLRLVTVEANDPPALHELAFANTHRDRIDLVVPFGAIQDYLDNGWHGFRSISFGIFTVDDITYGITSAGEVMVVDYTGTATAVTIPETVDHGTNTHTVTTIGEGAFQNKQLANVELPVSVTSIRQKAFMDNQLTVVTIPGSVGSIGFHAFYNNPDLGLVTVRANNPPALHATAFANANRFQIDLVVPTGRIQAYVDNGWDGFRSISNGSPSPLPTIDAAPQSVDNLEPFMVNITFDDEVTEFEADDIQVTNATVSTLTGSGSTYTATIVPTSLCNDKITIDVPADVATGTHSRLPNLAATQIIVAVDPRIACSAGVQSSSPMIPTAFTPNGDGANDHWIIDHLSEDASVRIYDRHGTIIFSSDDGYTRPWDGTSRGSRLPAGSYLYLIQNGPHTYRGSVTILL